jgi:hypothetical protein
MHDVPDRFLSKLYSVRQYVRSFEHYYVSHNNLKEYHEMMMSHFKTCVKYLKINYITPR